MGPPEGVSGRPFFPKPPQSHHGPLRSTRHHKQHGLFRRRPRRPGRARCAVRVVCRLRPEPIVRGTQTTMEWPNASAPSSSSGPVARSCEILRQVRQEVRRRLVDASALASQTALSSQYRLMPLCRSLVRQQAGHDAKADRPPAGQLFFAHGAVPALSRPRACAGAAFAPGRFAPCLGFASGAIGGCWRSVGRRGGAPKFVTYPLILIVHLPKGLTFTKKARVGTANGHFLK